VRLAEEICMLDHLTRGRLELGIGRGTSPHEMAVFNVDAAESRAMFEEALAIITAALVEGKVSYEGRHFAARDVELMVRPVQRPYPPLWYPTSNVQSVPWVAGHGISTMFSHNTPTLEQTRENVDTYWRAYAERRAAPDRLNGHVAEPWVGVVRHVFVADTDAEALRVAREAWKAFNENHSYLRIKRGLPPAAQADFDASLGERLLVAGSPETVREGVQAVVDASTCDYFTCVFSWGSLSPEQVLRSVDLFTRQVRPAITPARGGVAA
jgi:alkanesulfonate monooxygenase SsuD/methylene tetrahydromethanopterin reductase-like flavin-dependent oxidoreductase (luciferase family)